MMKYLTDKGYEIDFSGSHWKMKLPQYKHFTRLDTLDERLTPIHFPLVFLPVGV